MRALAWLAWLVSAGWMNCCQYCLLLLAQLLAREAVVAETVGRRERDRGRVGVENRSVCEKFQ